MVVIYYNKRFRKIESDAFPGDEVEFNGKKFVALVESMRDMFSSFRRKPQVILPEVGMFIASKILPMPSWVAIDAGGGSGFMAILMAYLLRDGVVHVFEKNPEHTKVIRKNVEKSGLGNVVVHEREFTGEFEGSVEWVNLDMKHPEKVLPRIYDNLVPGGFVSVYSPQIEQVIAVSREADSIGMHRQTFELNWRSWKVDTRGYTHPSYSEPPHTGFVTILRKVYI